MTKLRGINEWLKKMPLAEARTFSGVFANQNAVCRLRDVTTLDFLSGAFGPPE